MKLHRSLSACILLSAAPLLATAQHKKVWYNEIHQKTDSAHAALYDIFTPENGKYKISEYSAKGHQLQMTGYCVKPETESFEGPFTFYTDGVKSAEGSYKNNKLDGLWKHYYTNSEKVWYTEQYTDGKLTELKSYYENGKIKRAETHDDVKGVTGKHYAEDGSELPFTPFFMSPSPPYDPQKYLSGELRYPDKAKSKNISGTVIVKFVVEADGTIGDVSVIKRLGGGCDEEAMRVIKGMPKWTPCVMDDKKIKMPERMPVTFKFQ